MKLNSTKDMMTPRQVAAASGIGINAVYLLLKQRHIPSINVGHDMYIPRPQYLRWLETVEGNFPGPASRNSVKEIPPHLYRYGHRQVPEAEFVKRILKPREPEPKPTRRRRALGRKRKRNA